jgi:hypothetical protein
MSIIAVDDGPAFMQKQAFALGQKIASDGVPAYNLAGMFYVTKFKDRDWAHLSVPNALVHGIFSAMHESGIELPPSESDGRMDAHITVMRPEEIALLGGPERLKGDRGKTFKYTIGRLMAINPGGWKEMSKAWVLRVHSPELQELRRSYGLSSLPNQGTYDFHITVAVRRTRVLGRNEVSKVPTTGS